MNGIDLSTLLGGLVGFLLTLMVFSYLFGDNVLFRTAIHIFIGVAAGYTAAVVITNLIVPRLVLPFLSGMPDQMLLAAVPLLGALLLLSKATTRLAGLGSPVMAFLVGVGAAALIGGAVLGTLLPQVRAGIQQIDRSDALTVLNGLVILAGTLATLAYFQFNLSPRLSAGSPGLLLRGVSATGQVFIAVTLGTIFAGVYAAALAALIERWDAIIHLILVLITPAA
ncbi:MAG: hypothetical protein ACKOC5_15900 [Chloroflexota bacterium]